MKRLIFFIGCIVVIIICCILAIFFILVPRPEIQGSIKIEGLMAPVTIVRDAYGIPYIKAENEKDLFFGLGFVNAQDRLWQMELLRRIAYGRLSEVFGDVVLKNDIFLKTIGIDEIAQKQAKELSRETYEIFESFARGINEGMRVRKKKPLEFRLLKIQPDPWKVEDSIAVFELLLWQLSFNFKLESIMAELAKELGVERAFELLSLPADITYAKAVKQSNFLYKLDFTHVFSYPELGLSQSASNAWVVTGNKTETGKTLLANDTHQAAGFPSPFYLVHIEFASLKATGMMLPGVPSILSGSNGSLAWAITNMGADVQDLYLEKIKPDKNLFLYKGNWEPLKEKKVQIKVKEAKDNYRTVHHIIQKTHNGPIIKKLSDTRAVSLRWSNMDGYPGIAAIFELVKSKTCSEFEKTLRSYQGTPMNFIYADTKGSIAHHAAGRIPKRRKGDGFIPLKGWLGENEWKEFISFDSLPGNMNPQENYLIATNEHMPSPTGAYIPGVYAPDSRTERLNELLKSKSKFSVQDIMDMQLDETSLIARKIWSMVYSYVSELKDKEVISSLKYMKDWQGDHKKEAVAPLIFNTFLEKLILNVYKDEIKNDNLMKYLSHWYYFIDRFVFFLESDEGNSWFDDKTTDKRESKKEIIQKAYIETISALQKRLGKNMDTWKWGDVHTITFKHFLGKKGGVLGKIFNYGPFEYGGGIDTLNRASYDMGKSFTANFTTCSRMIVDFSDMKKVYFVLSTGQSAEKFSPHASDQMKLFLKGSYIGIDPEEVYVSKDKHTLILIP